MEQKVHAVTLLAVLFLSVTALAVFGANEPTPPRDFSVGQTSTFDESNYASQTAEALAGNITALVMHAVTQTKTWQGYYGNITATITLDDASDNTFYNWSAAEPRGQVYATLNDSRDWDNVRCYDFSNGSTGWDAIETYYGIAVDDVDGVNETYERTNHPSFEVGSRTMTGCPTTYVFRDDTNQTTDFANVLLFDPSDPSTGWIYTTVIENDTVPAGSNDNDLTCFNGQECDFQLLVNEDGHGTDTSVTTYYFWVELS